MTENWFSSEKRNLLLAERYFSGSHHYFFEVKEAKNSSKYIINNYCNKLKQGSIELSGRTTEEFYNHHKQVWIITRGTTRQIKLVNSIEVKEVAINDIMYLYQERLKCNMNNQSLEIKLRNI
ncbi:hypothetical protein PL10110_1010030 [Planktothrix agardhii]|uniref:hypothetical protein n=1 Tax=Planktothrix agardhii TaxID=1160 RepID=UPI001B9F4908|nr:hypothetical protein [Planktothrix agardhii]CAD0217856.1 hypothetical protein PL10110_1010030 [Planktothrix agardhii]